MKAFVTLASSLLCVAIGSAPTSGSQQSDRHYELGVTYERSLEIFEAVDEFKAAVALDPDNTGLWEHYAWLLHAYQFREEAVEAFERLRSRDTDRRAVSLGLGWNEMDLGRAARAIGYFGEVYVLEAPPEDVGRSYVEIRAWSVRENEAKIEALEKKLADDPGNVALEKELFQLHVYQSEWDEAFAGGERLLAASRDDLAFRFAYYRGLCWAGRWTEAERILTSLMADSPDNAYLVYEHGRLLRATNRLKEAEAAFAESRSLYPGAVKTRKELAEALALRGKHEEAVLAATSLLGDAPGRLEARLAPARVDQYAARWEEAAVRYREVLADYPYNVEALSGLAECALRTGDLSGAEEAVKAWEVANIRDPGLKRIRTEIRNAASSILVQADAFSNNSHYSRWNAGFAAKLQARGGLNPRLGYSYSRFEQRGFSDVERHSFLVEADAQLATTLSVAGRLGLNLYDNDQDHLTGAVTVRASPFSGTYVSASYSHFDIIDTEPVFGNPLYNYVASIGAVGEGITTDDGSLYLQQMIGDDLMLWGSLAYGAYSDGNEKLTYVLGADYRLSEEPFLHIHYSFFFLDYQDPAPIYREGDSRVAAYFDPDDFRVHTPGIEFAFNLTPALRVYLADDVSYVLSTESVTNSIACALTYDFTKENSLRLDLRFITDVYRDDDDGDYDAEHVLLSFFHRF